MRIRSILQLALRAGLVFLVALALVAGVPRGVAQELAPQVLYQARDSIVIELEFPALRFDTVDAKQSWIVPRMEGAVGSLQKGAPDLPRYALPYPVQADALRLYVLDTETDFHSLVEVAPSYGSRIKGEEASWQRSKGEIYSKNALYPSSCASLGTTYMLHQQRGQSVLIHPVRYNPLRKELHVARRMRLAIAGTLVQQVTRPSPTPYGAEIASHFSMPLRAPEQASTGIERLIIVSPEKYQEELAPLIEWKRLSGYEVELHTYGEGHPLHDTVSLTQFVRNRYEAGNGFKYLLLVGGRKDIPPLRRSGPKRKADSDQAYGQVIGNDAFNEVYVGRFSARTPSQVRVQVEKTIRYERDLNRTDTWLNRVLGISSNEPFTGDANETDKLHARGILKRCLSGCYSHADSIFAGYPMSTRPELIRLLNAGTGFVNYTGHGFATRWQTTDFRVEHVNSLTNANRTPFIMNVACSNGEMDHADPTFAEAWLWATHNGNPSGAVVISAASELQAWDEPMRAQDVFANYASGYYEHSLTTYGAIFARSLSAMLQVYSDPITKRSAIQTANTWNIFGDPSLRLRTRAPQALDLQYSTHIYEGMEEYRIAANRDGALAVMRITPANGSAPRYLRSRVMGTHAAFQGLDFSEGDRVVVAVTGFNLESFVTSELVVQASQAPRIVFEAIQLVNESQAPVEVISPGMQLQITGNVAYTQGELPLKDVSLRYSVYPPEAAELLSEPEIALEPFHAHGAQPGAVRLPLRVSGSHSDASQFTIGIEAIHKNLTLAQITLPIVVSAPGLLLDSVQILGDASSNSHIEPGEEFTVGVWLTNTGLTQLSAGHADFQLRGAGKETTWHIPFGPIPAKSTQRISFPLKMIEAVGESTICRLAVSASWLSNTTPELDIVIPIALNYRKLHGEVANYPFAEANARQVISMLIPSELLPKHGMNVAAVRIPVRSEAGEGDVLGRIGAVVDIAEGNDWAQIDWEKAFSHITLFPAIVEDSHVEIPIPSFFYDPQERLYLTIVTQGLPNQAPYAVPTISRTERWLVGQTGKEEHISAFSASRLPKLEFRAAQLVDYKLVVQQPQGALDDYYTLRIGNRMWRIAGSKVFQTKVPEGLQTLKIQTERYVDTLVQRHFFGSELIDTIILNQPPQQPITLKVEDDRGNPVRGVEIAIQEQRVTTDYNGKVALLIRPGRYTIQITFQDKNFELQLVVSKSVGTYTFRIAYVATSASERVPLAALFPNPARGAFEVKAEEELQSVSIYTLHGQLLQREGASGPSHRVDMHSTPSGIYLVKVAYRSGRAEMHRLVVE